MAKPYPQEFRDEVVTVADKAQASLAQIAREFGVSEGSLANWMRQADIEDGKRPAGLTEDERQLLEADKRIRFVEQEEVLRRAAAYLSQANLPGNNLPLVREMAAARAPIRVPVAVTLRVLGLSRQGYYQWLNDPISQRDWDDAHLNRQALRQSMPMTPAGLIGSSPTSSTSSAASTSGRNRVRRLCRIAGIHASHQQEALEARLRGSCSA